jgi:hypothetical protein
MENNRGSGPPGYIDFIAGLHLLGLHVDQPIVSLGDDSETVIVFGNIGQVIDHRNVLDLHTAVVVPDHIPVKALDVAGLGRRLPNDRREFLQSDLFPKACAATENVAGFSTVKSSPCESISRRSESRRTGPGWELDRTSASLRFATAIWVVSSAWYDGKTRCWISSKFLPDMAGWFLHSLLDSNRNRGVEVE